jgi:hypothetical protein
VSADETQRLALIRDLTRRLAIASHDEIRAVDLVLTALELARSWRWVRRHERDKNGDLCDQNWHIVRVGRTTIDALCSTSWPNGTVLCDVADNPPLAERCTACWRAMANGSARDRLVMAAVADLALDDSERAPLREAARVEIKINSDVATAINAGENGYRTKVLGQPAIDDWPLATENGGDS